MAKAAALKSAWIVIGVVVIIQLMDSCENWLCKTGTVAIGSVIVAIGSWAIVKYTRK